MQYLLTAEEYTSLTTAKKQAEEKVAADMQTLCTEVANLKPIVRPWTKEGAVTPWGCILNKAPLSNPVYCDCCPVKDMCPNKCKNWSK